MPEMKLAAVESRFAEIIWKHEPLHSRELVKLCEQEPKWNRSTTYTVLRKLCGRGIFKNEGGTVSSQLSRQGFYAVQSKRLYPTGMEQVSLPITAWTMGTNLIWRGDALTTAAYSFSPELYDYEGRCLAPVELPEDGSYIRELAFSEDGAGLIVTILSGSGTSRRRQLISAVMCRPKRIADLLTAAVSAAASPSMPESNRGKYRKGNSPDQSGPGCFAL